MNDDIELERQIRERLEEIKPVLARDTRAAYRARMQFLAKAVSASEEARHKGWSSIFRKERFAMNLMISILVIAGLLFGGGATVNAAQDDLPNEPLYSLKMWTEDISLQVRNEPDQKVDRLMELAQVRIQEMTRLADAGQAIPDQTRLRLEQHIHQALQICSTLEDNALDQALLQIRDRLQQQDRDMEQLQLHAPQDVQPVLAETRTMLQQRLRLVDEGLVDHEIFSNAAQNGFRYGQDEEVTRPVQNGNGEQNGQPTSIPAGPNPDPGSANSDPGGPNLDPNGPNHTATPSTSGGGSGPAGNGPGGGGSGGSASGGGGAGSGGSGGSGSGGGSGGEGSGGGGSGGEGSGGKKP
jgi:hypothetical protein